MQGLMNTEDPEKSELKKLLILIAHRSLVLLGLVTFFMFIILLFVIQ